MTNVPDLLALEQEMMARFAERARPFHDLRSLSQWDQLFLMQHYRVPTRLLDWSENPLVALYFALQSADQTTGHLADDAAVWVLRPTV